MENPSQMNQDVVGTRRGDYEILGLLGAGGMGQVFKVRNVLSGRIEAMKVLLPNLADQKDLADRFMREIKVLAGLHHPNIAELRTALTIDNQLVMIMEYVEGATLAARIQQGAIPYGQALGYIDQVLGALGYAHQQHIVHRDIKPSNMMLTPSGVVKLMDFGIAQRGDQGDLTKTNTTVGSYAYMSPEQIKGEPVDGRSDLYSVGVSLYEMVTGQKPFPSDTAFSTMQAHLQTAPRPPIELRPDLPPALSQLILMAVAKDSAARFQTADAFAAALKSVAPKVAGTVAAVLVPAAAPGAAVASSAKVSTPPAPSPAMQTASMPPPAEQWTHRGLYITLGAVIVLVVLVAAAFEVPRHARTAASRQQASATTSNAAPAATPATSVDTSAVPAPNAPAADAPPANTAAASGNPADANPPAAATQPTPATSQPASMASAQPSSPRHKPKAPDSSTPATPAQSNPTASMQPPAPDPAQLQALDLESDQLSGRASSVVASLDTLQRQQAAQGLGLRGDMVASKQRMETYMSKAQAAIQARDADGARKYLDLAGAEVEKLEKLLGR
jgi:tRNA A-37 threonylcarbamoyl transferase component Bud32